MDMQWYATAVGAVFLVAGLAGCTADDGPATMDAQTALSIAAPEADRYDQFLFLSLSAIDGPFDAGPLLDSIEDDDSFDAQVRDGIAWDYAYGEPGDGLVGSWSMTGFGLLDDVAHLVLVQALPDGTTNRISHEVQLIPSPFDAALSGTGGPCGDAAYQTLQEQLGDLSLDFVASTEIAAAMMANETIQEATETQPDGELHLGVTPWVRPECDGGNGTIEHRLLWIGSWVDLDEGSDRLMLTPPQMLIFDAATGEPWQPPAIPVDPLPPPEITGTEVIYLEVTDATVTADTLPSFGIGDPTVEEWTFEVPEETLELRVEATQEGGGALSASPEFRLLDPDGEAVIDDQSFIGTDQPVREPAAGTWTVEFSFHSREPGESYSIDITAMGVEPET